MPSDELSEWIAYHRLLQKEDDEQYAQQQLEQKAQRGLQSIKKKAKGLR
jgi:hypothetical protein